MQGFGLSAYAALTLQIPKPKFSVLASLIAI
jgi:hypothetical protein